MAKKKKPLTAYERVKRWREKHPKEYAYLTLKNNAKRRKKEFTITFEDFKKFCYRYKYIGKKGRTAEGYGVDRHKEDLGYTYENMRIKKNGNNVKKYKAYDWQTRTGTTLTTVETPEDKETNPF